MKHGKMELVIQFPKNVEFLSCGKESQPSQETFAGKLNSTVMGQREKIVRARLTKRCVEKCGNVSQVTNEQMGDISLYELKEQPKQQKKVTMDQFISMNDTKQIVIDALENAKKEEAITKKPQAMESDGTSSDQDEFDGDSSEEAEKRANKFGVKTGISSATAQAI